MRSRHRKASPPAQTIRMVQSDGNAESSRLVRPTAEPGDYWIVPVVVTELGVLPAPNGEPLTALSEPSELTL